MESKVVNQLNPNYLRRITIWQTRLLPAKTAMQSSCLLKVNRLSTRRKGSRMNRKDVLIAEKPESNKKEAIPALAEEETEAPAEAAGIEALAADGKLKESANSPF